jgi:hypothetical protein
VPLQHDQGGQAAHPVENDQSLRFNCHGKKGNLTVGNYEVKKEGSLYHWPVLNAAIGILLLSLLQASQTGTVIAIVKGPNSDAPASARAVLLPPKYTEIWNRQVQTRLDNYWEIFKPEFIKDKEHFLSFHRMAQVEAFRYVTSNMRRDLGDAASKLMKETSPTGQLDFTGVSFGTYQLLVHATVSGRDLIWTKTVDVQTEIPTFVDLGRPVS